MLPPFDYFDHVRICNSKQRQREERIRNLPALYRHDIDESDRSLLGMPLAKLVQDIRSGHVDPVEVLHCYGRVALRAHKNTNCLTEIMLKEAEQWIKDNSVDLQGPLAGVPISLKDTISVAGFDTSVGYSVNCERPELVDGTLVKILKAAGSS